MQQPNMIVLALIAQGFHYGLEMEKFIDRSKMRQWAQIGKSTIYKVLRDLQASGDVTAKVEAAERGPGKTVFKLTRKGRKTLESLVSEAMRSRVSVYSDRIAGLFFTRSLPKPTALSLVEQSIDGLARAINMVEQEGRAAGDKPIAQLVIDFYKAVYQAELQAMLGMKKLLLNAPEGKGAQHA
jgi:DNA-binding PadR family transcriptional regulator